MGFSKLIFLIFLLSVCLNASADGKSSSSSSSSSANKDILFQVGGGTTQLNQYMATDHVEHPLAGFLAGRYHKNGLQAGVCYLTTYHHDATGANPPGQLPNQNEVDATETFQLAALCGGLLLADFLLLDVGYGYATFSRKESMPYSLTAQSSSYSANGMGFLVGGSVIPLRIGDHLGIGATYYYFDATAGDYSSDVVNGTTETTKSSGNGRVHSFGWFTGLSIFVNL